MVTVVVPRSVCIPACDAGGGGGGYGFVCIKLLNVS